MSFRQYFAAAGVLLLFASGVSAETDSNAVLRVASSTSIKNSGLSEFLIPRFLATHHLKLEFSFVGSGKALRMGRTGETDMVWVHSPEAEEKFMQEGFGINRHTIMSNDFVLAGPTSDPGGIGTSADALVALKTIATKQLPFVSRADDSGTHKRERTLWKQIAIDPYAQPWYIESGAGMKPSLILAMQKHAYIMIDRATFIVNNDGTYRIILEDRAHMANPYSVITVNPAKYPKVNQKAADIFNNWLASSEGQRAIAEYRLNGIQLFHPVTSE